MQSLEYKIVRFFNRIGRGRIDIPMRFFSSIRFLAVFWSIVSALAISRHPEILKPFVLSVVTVAGLHFLITEGIIKHASKIIFHHRKRPYLTYPNEIIPIGRKFSDSSFPSSHMATTIAMLFVIVSFYPSLFWLALVFAVFMAFSRLHNGMHYPSDVLAGIILGVFYGWFAIEIVKEIL